MKRIVSTTYIYVFNEHKRLIWRELAKMATEITRGTPVVWVSGTGLNYMQTASISKVCKISPSGKCYIHQSQPVGAPWGCPKTSASWRYAPMISKMFGGVRASQMIYFQKTTRLQATSQETLPYKSKHAYSIEHTQAIIYPDTENDVPRQKQLRIISMQYLDSCVIGQWHARVKT